MTISEPIVKSSIPIEPIPEIMPCFPPVAGFWKRLLAFLIDSILLGIFGQLIALTFSDFFYNIGPYGRPIGWVIALIYFGIMNSKLSSGQTLGKRLMKIAVRNGNNEAIGLGRSFVRESVIIAPALCNGWSLPILQNAVMNVILTIIVFGLGGAILYTMVFNRGTRQGIHDLLVGTYVVNLRGTPIKAFLKTARVHWLVSGIWFGLVIIASIGMVSYTLLSTPITSPSQDKSLYEILAKNPNYFTVSIGHQTTSNMQGHKLTTLEVTVWYKGKISEEEIWALIDEIARTVFDSRIDLSSYDGMRITITSSYDIGIATGYMKNTDALSISDWRMQLKQ
jgi:uncharacterized RDD family membrane protein YckC